MTSRPSRRAVLAAGALSACAEIHVPEEATARIARVENGLLPEFVISNRPDQAMRLEDEMRRLHIAGAQIAVIDRGRLAWARGYGVKGEDAGTVSSDTLFQAGSCSKSIAAATTLLINERGLIDIDADINSVLRSWRVPDNAFTHDRKATARRILCHTAGFNVHGFDGYARGASVPSLLQVLDGTPPANSEPIRVTIEPGSEQQYSGGGFTVLQQALIDCTGRPFDRLASDLVLAPAGMHDSTFATLSEPQALRAARGFRPDGAVVETGWHIYPEMAAASLWSTASDLACFVVAIQSALNGASQRLMGQATARLMTTPADGEAGLGVFLKGDPPFRFSHNGSTEGYSCIYAGFLATGQGAAVMTNSDSGADLTSPILRAIAREYGWNDMEPTVIVETPVDAATLSTFAGRYVFAAGGDFLVVAEGARLYGGPSGRPRVELIAIAPDQFHLMIPGGGRVHFLADSGHATGLVLTRRNREERATRQ